ncbi:hypothetical protein [Tsuneonella sp. SYSU-LHT278]|uniref:hypothetical protein n=1 Tax=Tsuneonella sediminis TaxID=3416089 RepID=UPI003F78FF48
MGLASQAAQPEIALAEAREHLRAGRPGLAIVALQVAKEDPTTIAEAANMMGVAYSMLGRGDLSERFFQQAIAIDPAEPKYAANLSRYYRSREAALARLERTSVPPVPFADGETSGEAIATATPVDRIIRAGPGVVRVTSPVAATAMSRISPREIAIRTAGNEHQHAASDGRRHNPRFVSIEAHPTYPVRINLASVTKK